MPKPPIAACGDDTLYVCERCGKCTWHCECVGSGLVSINSRKAAEAIRTAVRLKQEENGRKGA